jgi:hypothetical protein
MKLYVGIAVLLLVGVFAIDIWWARYKYQDCLRVGHTKTYCILDVGK